MKLDKTGNSYDDDDDDQSMLSSEDVGAISEAEALAQAANHMDSNADEVPTQFSVELPIDLTSSTGHFNKSVSLQKLALAESCP